MQKWGVPSQAVTRSAPYAAVVVEVRRGEVEPGSPGRRPEGMSPGQEGLAGSPGKDLKSLEDHQSVSQQTLVKCP